LSAARYNLRIAPSSLEVSLNEVLLDSLVVPWPGQWRSHGRRTTEAGVGGALGGVLGSVVGQQLGGNTGSTIGAALGGAGGSAVGADKRSRGEAAIGGALGAAGGNVLGRSVGGSSGALVGSAAGGGAGGALGNYMGNESDRDSRHYRDRDRDDRRYYRDGHPAAAMPMGIARTSIVIATDKYVL